MSTFEHAFDKNLSIIILAIYLYLIMKGSGYRNYKKEKKIIQPNDSFRNL